MNSAAGETVRVASKTPSAQTPLEDSPTISEAIPVRPTIEAISRSCRTKCAVKNMNLQCKNMNLLNESKH